MAILNMSSGGGGVRIPLEPVTGLEIENAAQSAKLIWTDPVDKVANPGGEVVAQWAHTVVVRKEWAAPTSYMDGVKVLQTDTRNQYQSTQFVDTGLTDYTDYYYAIYSVTTLGVYSEPTIQKVTAGEPTSLAFGMDITGMSNYIQRGMSTSLVLSLNGQALACGGIYGTIPGGGNKDTQTGAGITADLTEVVPSIFTTNFGSDYDYPSGEVTATHYLRHDLYYVTVYTESYTNVSGDFYHSNGVRCGIASFLGSAIFAGGIVDPRQDYSQPFTSSVCRYTDSLTKSTIGTLSANMANITIENLGNYAVIAGGDTGTGSNWVQRDTTNVLNSSFTMSSGPNLPSGARAVMGSAPTYGGGALFVGGLTGTGTLGGTDDVTIMDNGRGSSLSKVVDYISPDLVASAFPVLNLSFNPTFKKRSAGLNYKGYAIIPTQSTPIIYNRFLTQIEDPCDPDRVMYDVASVGDYALAFGNGNPWTYTLSL